MIKKILFIVVLLGASSLFAQQPVTIPDGGSTTLGAKSDAKSTATDSTAVTLMQVIKEISFVNQDLDTTVGTPGSAVPSKSQQMAGTDGTNAIVPYIDPCQRGAKTYTAINLASTTATKVISQVSSKSIYFCAINLISAGANNVVIITGTKTTNECDTTTAAMMGGTTAATGWNFAANGGIVIGNGAAAVMVGGTTKDICIIASASTQVSGTIAWVAY